MRSYLIFVRSAEKKSIHIAGFQVRIMAQE